MIFLKVLNFNNGRKKKDVLLIPGISQHTFNSIIWKKILIFIYLCRLCISNSNRIEAQVKRAIPAL